MSPNAEPAPGSIPSKSPTGPIRRTCWNCSRKSSSVNEAVISLSAAACAVSSSKVASAFSMSVITPPMPRIREATRSGRKTSRSSIPSPTPANLMGAPVTSRAEIAAPPLASPSNLENTRPVISVCSRKPEATLTASWPVMASRTSSTSSGAAAFLTADSSRMRTASIWRRPAVSTTTASKPSADARFMAAFTTLGAVEPRSVETGTPMEAPRVSS